MLREIASAHGWTHNGTLGLIGHLDPGTVVVSWRHGAWQVQVAFPERFPVDMTIQKTGTGPPTPLRNPVAGSLFHCTTADPDRVDGVLAHPGVLESLAALVHPRPTLILTGNRLAATPSDPVVFVAAVVPLIQAMATVPVEAE